MQYQPLVQQGYIGTTNLQQGEEIVQGKEVQFYAVNQNPQTGNVMTQQVNVNQINDDAQKQYFMDQQQQQQPNQNIKSHYPEFNDSYVKKPQNNNEDKKKDDEPKYIIHDVLPTDTLIGLSIRYNVSEYKIKTFNNLDSEEVWYKKQLKIPNPTTNLLNGEEDKDQEEVIRRQLIGQMKTTVLQLKDQSEKMAHYYLTEANWNIREAAKLYKEDLEWESKAQKSQKQQYQSLNKKKQ